MKNREVGDAPFQKVPASSSSSPAVPQGVQEAAGLIPSDSTGST